jgi:hypothetical protein
VANGGFSRRARKLACSHGRTRAGRGRCWTTDLLPRDAAADLSGGVRITKMIYTTPVEPERALLAALGSGAGRGTAAGNSYNRHICTCLGESRIGVLQLWLPLALLGSRESPRPFDCTHHLVTGSAPSFVNQRLLFAAEERSRGTDARAAADRWGAHTRDSREDVWTQLLHLLQKPWGAWSWSPTEPAKVHSRASSEGHHVEDGANPTDLWDRKVGVCA